MQTPAVGEMITTLRARALCLERGATFDYIVERIDATPEDFREWIFDGASMVPDELVAKLFGMPNLIEIALRHDLKYAYGEPGNHEERVRADRELKHELLEDGAPAWLAEVFHAAVRVFGGDALRMKFSWGFARIEAKPPAR